VAIENLQFAPGVFFPVITSAFLDVFDGERDAIGFDGESIKHRDRLIKFTDLSLWEPDFSIFGFRTEGKKPRKMVILTHPDNMDFLKLWCELQDPALSIHISELLLPCDPMSVKIPARDSFFRAQNSHGSTLTMSPTAYEWLQRYMWLVVDVKAIYERKVK
jgi:hypothetical protein